MVNPSSSRMLYKRQIHLSSNSATRHNLLECDQSNDLQTKRLKDRFHLRMRKESKGLQPPASTSDQEPQESPVPMHRTCLLGFSDFPPYQEVQNVALRKARQNCKYPDSKQAKTRENRA
ncbi:hypothetical protein ACH5RR_031890 [Cinchona calisaya]|uniref:Uncharacterized protein n=1 Tax=Cinchona calisaya TaxID=153742 RepID=A0ABD2YLT5_9GENT